jgi:site-specific recombinase XerC
VAHCLVWQAHPPKTPIPAFDDLRTLLPDWRTHLRARNVAPSAMASYITVGENLLAYLLEAGMPTTAGGVHGEHLEAFLADMGDRLSAATVATHHRSLQQLFRWLVDDGEIDSSPMAKMPSPAVPEQPVEVVVEGHCPASIASGPESTIVMWA